MSKFIRRDISNTIENNFLTASIISTKFLEEIFPIYNQQYLKNTFARILMVWILDYFERFGESPKHTIQSIFEIEKEHLDDAEMEIIQIFLKTLSKNYVEGQGINDEYILDQTMHYFRTREVEIRVENAQKLIDIGKIDKAEEELFNMKKVVRLVSNWSDPFSPEMIQEVFDDRNKGIFKFPGALGNLFGDLERGWFVAFIAPFKRGKCVAEGTLVTMSNGMQKPIENIIAKTDSVISMDNFKFVSNEVLALVKQGCRDVYTVKTKTGRSVTVTANHPFWSAIGWKKLEDLKVGNYIAVSKDYPEIGTLSMESHKIRLLAYLIADGCLRSGSYVYTKHDQITIKDFIFCVEKMNDSVTTIDMNNIRVCNKTGKSGGKISNTKQWMMELGLDGSYSKDKKIPNIIFSLTNLGISEFLRALFTGDGSVWKDRNNLLISYSTSSEVMSHQVQHLLTRFGVVSSIKSKIWKGFVSYEVIISDTVNTTRFLEKIGFLSVKNERAKEILLSLHEKRCSKSCLDAVPYEVIKEIIPYEQRWRSSTVGQCFKNEGKISNSRMEQVQKNYPNNADIRYLNNGDILYDEIVSISYIGKKETYDITVEKDHNFIANDIIVHNTWLLQEAAVVAALSGLKAVFISLEMKNSNINERIYKRITAYGGEEETAHQVPVFDCVSNQVGTCVKKERRNFITLYDGEGELPEFSTEMEYRACTVCKDIKGNKDYKLSTWFESMVKPEFNASNVSKKLRAIKKFYGDNLRIKCYPRFTASVSDIKRDLDILEQAEGFIPDVIVVDYADILKPEGRTTSGEPRHGIDEIWKTLASMAAERRSLLFTASQGNRGSIYKENIDQADLAEWIGKLGHVDLFASVNQSVIEKKRGIVRIGMLAHRHANFSEKDHVMLLQHFALGQTHLDSHTM